MIKVGLRFNKEKCKFKREKVNRLSADQSYISAIYDMQISENVMDVRRYLGIVAYSAKYTLYLSEFTFFGCESNVLDHFSN